MLLSRLLAAVMALFAVAVVSAVVLASTAEGTQSSDANNVALSEAVTSSSWSQQPATTQVSTPSSSSAPTDQAATAASSPSTVPTTDTTNVSTTTVALLAGASPSTTQAPTTTSASTTTQGPTTTAAPTTTQAPTTTVAPTTTQAPATTTTTAPGGSFNPSYESQFRSLINGLRSTPLLSDSSLNSYARNWAKHMADTDSFNHSNIGSLLDPWSTVGENIAWGYSVSSMFDGLNASPGHHANMVNTSFTHVGVGVWVDADGRIWTTHVFGG